MVFPIVTVSLNLGGGESSSPCLKFKVNVYSSPKSAVTGLQTTKIENRQQREQQEGWDATRSTQGAVSCSLLCVKSLEKSKSKIVF
jgi:hypothetical protein